MKFGRILREDLDGKTARLVVVEPEKNRVVDLRRAAALHFQAKRNATHEGARRQAAAAFPGSMSEALSLGTFLTEVSSDIVNARGDDASLELDSVEWLSACDPPVMRDSLNFIEHIKLAAKKPGRSVPVQAERIVPYTHTAASMLFGHNTTVPWPGYIKNIDYELEIGWVIGKTCHNLTPETAKDALFGLTLYNDFSGRDRQGEEVPIGMGATKSKNFAHAIGPWITTIDEFDDLYSIPMEVRLNGKTMCASNSGGALWKIEEIIAYASLGEYLRPGDLIGSGTPGGGSNSEQGVWLQPGDVVELEAGGIGVLRNVMGEPQHDLWWPTPQPGVLS